MLCYYRFRRKINNIINVVSSAVTKKNNNLYKTQNKYSIEELKKNIFIE